MRSYRLPIWKTAPFCRLLLPFISGIVLQWYARPSFHVICFGLVGFIVVFFLLHFISIEIRYKLQVLQGTMLNMIIAVFAMLITWQKDIRNNKNWFGHYYNDSITLFLRITEPPVEKPKSWKCEGITEMVSHQGSDIPVTGKIIVYFAKDSLASPVSCGTRLLIRKRLQPIKNSGNPGAFNYERYAAFQQVFHTVYLKPGEFILLKQGKIHPVTKLILASKEHIIHVLKKYLPADKNILGIAEALLIGYKEDLDKDLVQAYSNTGVVHIIAISGLHLGLIYVLLVWICSRLPFIRKAKLLQVLLIIGCLWFFSLLTGASASVLRSAVMFTCIVAGKNFFRTSSIYNSLAASAFLLLAWNPYLLWDVGFQLSYLAVAGIIWLQQHIYRSLYIKNRLLDKLWNMVSVTLAAQVITFPVCIYYFHQFPNLFLITNVIAVPLSTIILFAEIFLIAFSWIGPVAIYSGKLISLLIQGMNLIIKKCNEFPFSVLDNIHATVVTTWLLYFIVIGFCTMLLYKSKPAWRVAATALFLFSVMHVIAKFNLYWQKRIVVYNVPQHSAIDFISGNRYFFRGDSVLQQQGFMQNFHLKPGRISLEIQNNADHLKGLSHKNSYWQFFNKKILVIDTAISYMPVVKKLPVDILLISKNPRVKISSIVNAVKPSLVLFDSSNSLWKIANWKKECLALDLPCFSIPEQGAFVLNID